MIDCHFVFELFFCFSSFYVCSFAFLFVSFFLRRLFFSFLKCLRFFFTRISLFPLWLCLPFHTFMCIYFLVFSLCWFPHTSISYTLFFFACVCFVYTLLYHGQPVGVYFCKHFLKASLFFFSLCLSIMCLPTLFRQALATPQPKSISAQKNRLFLIIDLLLIRLSNECTAMCCSKVASQTNSDRLTNNCRRE